MFDVLHRAAGNAKHALVGGPPPAAVVNPSLAAAIAAMPQDRRDAMQKRMDHGRWAGMGAGFGGAYLLSRTASPSHLFWGGLLGLGLTGLFDVADAYGMVQGGPDAALSAMENRSTIGWGMLSAANNLPLGAAVLGAYEKWFR